jgi:pimeloyl-ACP methyl ester carboxylesterase
MGSYDFEVLTSEQLCEQEERRRVAARDGRGHLAALWGTDPERPPLVLVHGLRDCPSSLLPLAQALASDHQVLVFFYEDTQRYLDRSADDLARELVALASSGHTRLRVVAHSMGGVVARAALNSLVEPLWFPSAFALSPTAAPEPVRGAAAAERLEGRSAERFTSVELLTIDTPWHGFVDAQVLVRNQLPSESSLGDLVATSALFSALYAVPWPAHFRIDYIEAHNRAGGATADRVRGLAELADQELDWLFAALLDDQKPASAMQRNQLAALRWEHDYPALLAGLRSDRQAGRLDRERFLLRLRSTVATLPATHLSILTHPELPARIREIFTGSQSPEDAQPVGTGQRME